MSAEILSTIPDSKVQGANMGPIRGRQDPGGPHVGPMNIAIWDMVGYFVSRGQLIGIKAWICDYIYNFLLGMISHTCTKFSSHIA